MNKQEKECWFRSLGATPPTKKKRRNVAPFYGSNCCRAAMGPDNPDECPCCGANTNPVIITAV